MTEKEKKRLLARAEKLKPKPVLLPSGKWRCQVMVNGERISVIDNDPTIAHTKALAIKAGMMEKEKKSSSLTVGEAIDKYIESKDAVLSPSTIRAYRSLRNQTMEGLIDIQLSELTQDKIQREINKMARTKTPKTVSNAHGLLSATLGAYLPDMVLRTTLPQKHKKEINIPTVEEIQLLAEKSKGTKFELPFLLATWLGLRTSEIRGLTWDCIDGNILHIKQALVEGENGPVLKSTKSYSGNRKIHIPPYIFDLIIKQPRKDEYIIHYTRNAMYNHLRRMCDKYELPHYRFHDLRHVQASVMLMLNVPDKYAMERMGHASTNMLKNVYQHTIKTKSDEVAQIIDNFFEERLHTNLHTKK